MMLNLFVAVTCLALVTSSPFRESDGALRRKDASRVQLFSAKSETEKKQLFSKFKGDFGKSYANANDEDKRYQTFVNKLAAIDQLNQAEGAMIYGITKYSDLTDAEFASMRLGRQSTFQANAAKMRAEALDSPFNHLNHSAPGLGLAAVNVNWATSGRTTAIKDQGSCGSCWAFSAVDQIEADTKRVFGISYILSPQQIVDCDFVDGACDGGNDNTAFDYVKGAGGIVQNSAYTYTSGTSGVRGTCKTAVVSSSKVVTVQSYSAISGEANVAAFIQSTGPTTIYAYATPWSSYTGGIMTTASCPAVGANSLNHAIQIVGLVIPASGTSYWIVRNQWGTGWGVGGYIYLAYGTNTCGMFSDVAYYVTPKLVGTTSTTTAPTASTRRPSAKPSAPSKIPIAVPSAFPSTRTPTKSTRPPTVKPTVKTNQPVSRAPSATAGTWTCPAYSIAGGWYPLNAIPYIPCSLTACAGSTIIASSATNGGFCSGDTYVAILNSSGSQVAYNDDASSSTFCSTVSYTVPAGSGCLTYTLAQTCFAQTVYFGYGYLSCGGTFAVKGASKAALTQKAQNSTIAINPSKPK